MTYRHNRSEEVGIRPSRNRPLDIQRKCRNYHNRNTRRTKMKNNQRRPYEQSKLFLKHRIVGGKWKLKIWPGISKRRNSNRLKNIRLGRKIQNCPESQIYMMPPHNWYNTK